MRLVAYSSFTLVCLMGLSACDTQENSEVTHVDNNASNASINSLKAYVSPLPDSAPVYKAAISAGYAPFEFKDQYGTIIGYDIDLMRAVGEEAGFKVEFNDMAFPKLLSALASKKYDIGMSAGFSLDDENAKNFIQSEPYVHSRSGYWVKDESTYQTEEDLIGQKVSVQGDTNFHKYLLEKHDIEPVATTTSFLAFQEIFSGDVVALVEDESIMLYNLTYHNDYPVRFIPFTDFPLRQRMVVSASVNKYEIIENVNKGLKAVKSNGRYQEINQKWFGDRVTDIAVN